MAITVPFSIAGLLAFLASRRIRDSNPSGDDAHYAAGKLNTSFYIIVIVLAVCGGLSVLGALFSGVIGFLFTVLWLVLGSSPLIIAAVLMRQARTILIGSPLPDQATAPASGMTVSSLLSPSLHRPSTVGGLLVIVFGLTILYRRLFVLFFLLSPASVTTNNSTLTPVATTTNVVLDGKFLDAWGVVELLSVVLFVAAGAASILAALHLIRSALFSKRASFVSLCMLAAADLFYTASALPHDLHSLFMIVGALIPWLFSQLSLAIAFYACWLTHTDCQSSFSLQAAPADENRGQFAPLMSPSTSDNVDDSL